MGLHGKPQYPVDAIIVIAMNHDKPITRCYNRILEVTLGLVPSKLSKMNKNKIGMAIMFHQAKFITVDRN